MKILYVVLVHTTSIVAALSQLTITSADFQKNLGVSVKTTNYASSDTSGLRSVINASGANKTWNLSGRTYTASDTTTSTLLNKSSSGAPQQNDPAFSLATLVIRQKTSGRPSFTLWFYYLLTSTGSYYDGYVEDSTGIVSSKLTYVPSMLNQTYPATYLSASSGASRVTLTVYSPGGIGIQFDETDENLVDSYGTVTTPEGVFPCLRIRKKLTLSFGTFFSQTTYSYSFLDQNRTFATIGTDTGNVPKSVSYFRQSSVTGISDGLNPLPQDFKLLQNYPNPFNPSTRIEFSLPSEEFVTLRVYSALGQEVAVLTNEWKSAGRKTTTFDARNLPSGVYFYRLQAGNYIDTKKLLLIK